MLLVLICYKLLSHTSRYMNIVTVRKYQEGSRTTGVSWCSIMNLAKADLAGKDILRRDVDSNNCILVEESSTLKSYCH